MSSLYSLELEKQFLGGILNNSNIYSEIDRFISEKTFYHSIHGIIYSCFKSCVLNKESTDKIIIAQKIKNLGINFKDDLEIFPYLEAISFTQITPKATIEAAQELTKLCALRELAETCEKIKTVVTKNANDSLSKIVGECDKIYGDKISSFDIKEDEPENLFEGLLEDIEKRGNNPQEEGFGLVMPYPEFRRLYGNLRDGNLYVIVSRAKSGKSTILNHLGIEISKLNNVPVLYLDTEMAFKEMALRSAANVSGVPLWYLETGLWRKNEEFVKKVRSSLSNSKINTLFKHFHVGNKPIEEIKAICRRWYLKEVGRGKRGLIIYDYLKVPESGSGNTEWAEMGYKVDGLKKLSEELSIPIFTAGQTNRIGITMGKNSSQIDDSENSIGISDRISWYSSYVGILRKKTPDELVLDTPQMGTHKLITCVARWQGKEAAGHQDLIKRTFPDGSVKYCLNYINFEIDNFRAEERGTLRDSINAQNHSHLAIQNTNNHHTL